MTITAAQHSDTTFRTVSDSVTFVWVTEDSAVFDHCYHVLGFIRDFTN